MGACRPEGQSQAPSLDYPAAMAFELEPDFTGEWYGEIAGRPGTMLLGELNVGQLYGSFESDDSEVELVLLLDQIVLDLGTGGSAQANRSDFTWQDGRGSRGIGWLMINREDTAITGDYGYGQRITGEGGWSFIRVDDG